MESSCEESGDLKSALDRPSSSGSSGSSRSSRSSDEAAATTVATVPSNNSKMPQHISSSTRLMRNLAEKMRRDKLNMHISELATIVPMVALATKRVDKTSILRLSAAYLRMHQNLVSSKGTVTWMPHFLHDESLSSLLLEAVSGFLLVITTSGKVIYVSDGVEKILGHSPVDVVGQSVYNIIHPDDYLLMQRQLGTEEKSQRRSFYCHFVERCLSRNDCGRYSLVHIMGHMRQTTEQDEEMSLQENLLISVVRILRTQAITEISLFDGFPNEYITHHDLNARILCTDHRISLIAGYLPEEVMGKNAFDFIYPKDLTTSVFSLRRFLTGMSETTEILYRLCTKDRSFIYLRTRGILKRNSQTGEVQGFICTNKLICDKQGELELNKFVMSYTPRDFSLENSKNKNSLPSTEVTSKKSPPPSIEFVAGTTNPSSTTENVSSDLPVQLAASTLPSLSQIQLDVLSKETKSPSETFRCPFESSEAESAERTELSEKTESDNWSGSRMVSPDSYFRQCSSSSSSSERCLPSETNDVEGSVTSTTCDGDLLRAEIDLVELNYDWESTNSCYPNGGKVPEATETTVVTRRTSKRKVQQKSQYCHTKEYQTVTTAIANDSSNKGMSSESLSKRRRTRVRLQATTFVSQSSK